MSEPGSILAPAELGRTAELLFCLVAVPSCSVWLASPSAVGNTESPKGRLLQNGTEAIFLNCGMTSERYQGNKNDCNSVLDELKVPFNVHSF